MKFIVKGTMEIGEEKKRFEKAIEAVSESRARELTYNKIGADHKLKRTKIEIVSVEESK